MAKELGKLTNKERNKGHGKVIKVSRVSPMMHSHIKNVADHLGVSITDFCKVKMLDNLSVYPRHYLEPFNKD